MGDRAGLALALLLCLAGPVAARDEPRNKDVRAAVTRGREALEHALAQGILVSRTCQNYALGKQALACFAALRSGTKLKTLDRQFAAMQRVRFSHVYCASVYMLAVEARSVIRQTRTSSTRITSFRRKRPSAADTEQLARGARWLLRARTGKGIWRYGGPPEGAPPRKDPLQERLGAANYDHSNTQLAIYALHAASAAGVSIGAPVWREILDHTGLTQSRRGARVDLRKLELVGAAKSRTRVRGKRWRYAAARGWSYRGPTPEDQVTTTMTAAGVSCVAMAAERLSGLPATARGQALAPVAMRDGVAWLVRNWAIADRKWIYYELWTIEKAFSSTGVERLDATRHWWRIGAAWLLKEQAPSGLWRESAIESSFALLFLNRGTLPVWETEAPRQRRTGERTRDLGWDWSTATLPTGARIDVRQNLEALSKARAPKVVQDLVRETESALAALPRVAHVRALPWLVGLLSSKLAPARRMARQACARLLGGDEVAWRRWLAEWLAVEPALRERDPLGAARKSVAAARTLVAARDRPAVLRAAAAQVLVRIGSVESAGVLIDALDAEPATERRWAWTMLSTLVGRPRPFDPEASAPRRRAYVLEWRSWWRRHGPAFVTREVLWREVGLIADPTLRTAIQSRRRHTGKPLLPVLVAALEDEQLRLHAHAWLVRVTGKRLPATHTAWSAWLAGR